MRRPLRPLGLRGIPGSEIGWAEEIIEIGMASGEDWTIRRSSVTRLLIGSRIAWVRNRRALATEMANEAASVLESVGGLPLATAVLSDLTAGDVGRRRSTRWYGEKALAVAGEGRARPPTRSTTSARPSQSPGIQKAWRNWRRL